MSASDIGTTLAVSTAVPASYNQAGYEAETYTTVGSIASIGERGDAHETITPPADLATGRIVPLKGAVSGGEIAITCHTEAFADTGQDMIRTASATSGGAAASLLTFKETDPAGNDAYYTGEVISYMQTEASGSSYKGCSFGVLVKRARTVVEA